MESDGLALAHVVQCEAVNWHLQGFLAGLRGHELQERVIRRQLADTELLAGNTSRQRHQIRRFAVGTFWRHEDVQPNHLNRWHAFMNAKNTGVAAVYDQRLNGNQRWQARPLSMQKADSVRHAAWRQISH